MSRRSTFVLLKKEVCKIAMLSHGGDFISDFIYRDFLSSGFMEEIFSLAKECDELMGGENFLYEEVTDKETIERLHKYDTDAINMDTTTHIFVKFDEDNDKYDVTIKMTLYPEDDEEDDDFGWKPVNYESQEKWEADCRALFERERAKEQKFLRDCVGIEQYKQCYED